MHLVAILAMVGVGFGAHYVYKRYKLNQLQGSASGDIIAGRNGTNEAVNQAAHDDAGSGEATNVYDAVLGVASIVGGVITTGMSQATGDVEDDTADVVDRVATNRSEAG